MSRYCHDRTSTISHHNVVSNEDRNLLAVHRVDTHKTFDLHTCLILDKLCTLELGLLLAFRTVCLDGIHICNLVSIFIDQRMLRCDNHESYTEQCIWSCCINLKLLICSIDIEVYKCTSRLTNPVFLLLLYICRIVDILQALQKLICIFCNLQIPNRLRLLYNLAVADITLTSLTVLVGKNNLTAWTIVNECCITEYKSLLEHLQENPLCPLVELLIGCIDHTAPVKRESNPLQLLGKSRDILICDLTRMGTCLDCIVLCWQTKCIESDWEQYVVTLHTTLSGYDFYTGISLDMSYMHTRSTWIRELY